MDLWISPVASIIGIVIAYIRLHHLIIKDRRDREEQFKKSIAETIGRIETAWVEDNRVIHDRIEKLEVRTFSTLLDRLSNMEGELKILKNILDILQQRFMGKDK